MAPPEAASSSAAHAVCDLPVKTAYCSSASGGSAFAPRDISTEASPLVSRTLQASCLISIIWSTKESASFTARVSWLDNLASVSSSSSASLVYSAARPARRSAFGRATAAVVSACSAVNFSIARPSVATAAGAPSRSAPCNCARVSFMPSMITARCFTSASLSDPGASAASARLVCVRSLRRLCSALKMWLDAPAAAEMRLTVCSLFQDCHDPIASRTMIVATNAAMTDLSNTFTDRRFMVGISRRVEL